MVKGTKGQLRELKLVVNGSSGLILECKLELLEVIGTHWRMACTISSTLWGEGHQR